MKELLLIGLGVVIGVLVENLFFKKKTDCNPADEQLKQQISDKLDKAISDIKSTV